MAQILEIWYIASIVKNASLHVTLNFEVTILVKYSSVTEHVVFFNTLRVLNEQEQ